MSRSTRQTRRWFLEVRERRVYITRDGEEMTSFAGCKMGAVKDISIGKEQDPN